MKIRVCIETEVELNHKELIESNCSFRQGFVDVLYGQGERCPDNLAYMAGMAACITAIYGHGDLKGLILPRCLKLPGDSLKQGIVKLKLALKRSK